MSFKLHNTNILYYDITLHGCIDTEYHLPSYIDAPVITSIHNYTIYHVTPDVEQSALLGCAVSNTEVGLDIWVNWTTVSNEKIRKHHITLQKEYTFYLLLSNASGSEYVCKIFSEYSGDAPETQRTLIVAVIGQCSTWVYDRRTRMA